MKLNIIKKIFATAALASTLLLPVSSADAANQPRFNFMQNDLKTLRGANRTEAQTEWQSSVSGKAGDEFRGIVYIHNGILDSTATNTKVKVTIPSQTTNKTATITVTISADNAATVTDTLNVTLNEDATLAYIPGKTAWFPTQNGSATTQVAFPNGQTGDEIVTSGVNVGSVNGCWEFVQYVSFGFRSISKTFPNLTISKTVRNVSAGETSFVESNQAVAKDTLEYKIDFKNTGSATAENVVLIDTIPGNTSYISGSAVISRGGGSEQKATDTITGDGIVICNLAAGESGYVKFRVKISDNVPQICLINKATIFFNKVSAEDTAQTCIKGVVVPSGPSVGPALPVSGAGTTTVVSLLTLLAGYIVYSLRVRKIRQTVECQIANDLLNK